jgi:hypothetical protein
VWRHDYLLLIKAYRNKGTNGVYTAELWVDTETAVGKIWKDMTLKAPQQDFLAYLSTGLKPPNALGLCFAFIHMDRLGFLPNAQLIFLYK